MLTGTQDDLAPLERYARDLPMLFIVSEVEMRRVPTDSEAGINITIERSGGSKCDRCWRYVPFVSNDPAFAGLCERCQNALAEPIRG